MRKILVVVDMQNDFIDGALGSEEAAAIVKKVKNKIISYPAKNILVTMDTHGDDYLETQEGKNLPVKHCVRGTHGWQLRQEIAEALNCAGGAKVFEKPAFGSVELAEYVKCMAQVQELEIEMVGLCTDICVVSNALLLKAFVHEARVTVDAACCAGVTPEKHAAALEVMRSCQVNVIN